MGRPGSRLMAGGVGLFVALCLAEGAVRLLGLAPAPPDRVDPGMQFHTFDDDPEIGYTLRPGAQGTFQNAAVRVNERGCRDDPTLSSPALRVIALGDSITFGASIDQDETWEARLDLALGDGVDIVNCGVSGYNLLQALGRYEDALSDLSPDIILLNVFSDDLSPPYKLNEGGLRMWVRRHSAAFRVGELGWLGILGGGGRQLPAWAEDADAYRVGAMRRALAWVHARVAEGSKVLVVAHPMLSPVTEEWQGTHSDVRALAELLDQPTLFLEPFYVQATGGRLQRLSIDPPSHNPHPNLDGQELMALILWRQLYELGWIGVEPASEAGPR